MILKPLPNKGGHEALPEPATPQRSFKMIHEERYNEEKQMTLETPASKLATRLQQVNPSVTIEIAKQLIEAAPAIKEKVVEQYGINQTEQWHEDVKGVLNV